MTRLPERDGRNPVERKALWKVQTEIAALPASIVVQLAIWPDSLTDFAEQHALKPSVVYNCLAGMKPYERVRELLARRLGVTRPDVDRLIDCPRPTPRSTIPPDPPREAVAAPPAPGLAPAYPAPARYGPPAAAALRRRRAAPPPRDQIALEL